MHIGRAAAGPGTLTTMLAAVLVGCMAGAALAWRVPEAPAAAGSGPGARVVVRDGDAIPSRVRRIVAAASVRVEASRCDGVVRGSGVVLSDGEVVTNRHVLSETSGARLVTSTGNTVALEQYGVRRVEDLARADTVGSIPGAAGIDALPAPVAVGDRIVIGGFPGGRDLALATGRVTGPVDGRSYSAGPERLWLTDVPVEAGSSGSGVFDTEGRFVGIVVAMDLATGGAVVIPAARLEAAGGFAPVGWRLCGEPGVDG